MHMQVSVKSIILDGLNFLIAVFYEIADFFLQFKSWRMKFCDCDCNQAVDFLRRICRKVQIRFWNLLFGRPKWQISLTRRDANLKNFYLHLNTSVKQIEKSAW